MGAIQTKCRNRTTYKTSINNVLEQGLQTIARGLNLTREAFSSGPRIYFVNIETMMR